MHDALRGHHDDFPFDQLEPLVLVDDAGFDQEPHEIEDRARRAAQPLGDVGGDLAGRAARLAQ